MSNSVEVAPLFSSREARLASNSPRWQRLALLLLVGWLYASILARLVSACGSDPILIPISSTESSSPYSLCLFCGRTASDCRAIVPDPSWAGIPLLALSLIMLSLGEWGAEIFTQRVSLLVLLAGLIILFRGWTFFRAVLFPWAFLFLMIPIPNLIISRITFPLQLLASKLAFALLELVGVPVLREGNMLTLAAIQLDVAEACSGIRSLLSLVTLAIIYGYLMETRKWVRVALVCLALPIAVAANSFRIFGTGLLAQYWNPDKAKGFYHEFSGLLIFALALLMLFAVHRVFSILPISKRGAEVKSV